VPFPVRATGILSYFTRHRTAANLLLVLMLAAGLAAFRRCGRSSFPTSSPTRSTSWSAGTAPGAEDVDEAIVAVLEPVLVAVPGVAATSATSREGRASIEIEFDPGWDMSRAADDVQAAIDSVTDLPEGADTPDGPARRMVGPGDGCRHHRPRRARTAGPVRG
jgi:multidrug efflux pump subunit AcrB